MSSKIPANFYPNSLWFSLSGKIFNKIYTEDVARKYLQISQSIKLPTKVFTTRLAKYNCSVVGAIHLEHFLLAERVFECTSEEGEGIDYWFEGLHKRYCKSCIRQHIKK